MKTLVQRVHANPKYAKAFEWGRLISITGGAQVIVQAIGLISGILVIRLLPTQEYAFYTLANTMLGTMTILADGGVSTGVMAQGGKVWQDKNRLGAVLATGFHLKKKFAIGSLVVATPILMYLLWHHGASFFTSALIVLSLVPAFLAALSDTLLEIAPKLKQDIKPLQINQVGVNLGRLTLLGLTSFIFPWAFIAILAGGLPRIWGNIRLHKISARHANLSQSPDPVVKKEILSSVTRILPGAIYYCVSGQITIWLISIFGTTAAIAQIGALGRLMMVLTLVSTLFSTLVVPRFARLAENKRLLLSHFLRIQLALVVISLFVVSCVALFPTQVLWILGKDYSMLQTEVLLITISSCVGMMAGLTFSISVSRGWIMPPTFSIMIRVITQFSLIVLLDLSTTKSVLFFSIINSLVDFSMLFFYFILKGGNIKGSRQLVNHIT